MQKILTALDLLPPALDEKIRCTRTAMANSYFEAANWLGPDRVKMILAIVAGGHLLLAISRLTSSSEDKSYIEITTYFLNAFSTWQARELPSQGGVNYAVRGMTNSFWSLFPITPMRLIAFGYSIRNAGSALLHTEEFETFDNYIANVFQDSNKSPIHILRRLVMLHVEEDAAFLLMKKILFLAKQESILINLNETNSEGLTLLDLAYNKKYENIISLLKNEGAKTSEELGIIPTQEEKIQRSLQTEIDILATYFKTSNKSPLHILRNLIVNLKEGAALPRIEKIIRLAEQESVVINLNKPNSKKLTLLDLANNKKCKSIVLFLKSKGVKTNDELTTTFFQQASF